MTTTAEQIQTQATESAAAHEGMHYASYTLHHNPQDVSALAARLGREPTSEERTAFRRAIQDRLCAAMGGSPTPLADRQQDRASRYLDGDERALGAGPEDH